MVEFRKMITSNHILENIFIVLCFTLGTCLLIFYSVNVHGKFIKILSLEFNSTKVTTQVYSMMLEKNHSLSQNAASKNKAFTISSTSKSVSNFSFNFGNFYRTLDERNVTKKNETKYILYWDTFFGDTGMSFGLGKDIFKDCPVNSCFATHNHTYMPEEKFDAIVFHAARYNSKSNGSPKNRSIYQKYIFYTLESPYNTHFDDTFYNSYKGFYNWTLNYRQDADIHHPYAIIKKQETNYKMPSIEFLKNKTVMAAWLVSNCVTQGTIRRKDYVKELQKYITVDVYGACGTKKCSDCRKMIEEKYFFYLAFENTMCQDYVTEKVFNNLQINVIPVVLGFSDYNKIAPPHSVIDTNDFSTPKILAEYLIKLTKNLDTYLEYFEWKKHFVVENSKKYALCELCTKLHEPLVYSSYEDIRKWYYGFHCYV